MKTLPESTVKEDIYTPHREIFDKWASNYDGYFLQRGAFTPVHDIIIKHLGEIPPASKFLDIACGTGNLALRLAEIVPEGKVVGLDFSPVREPSSCSSVRALPETLVGISTRILMYRSPRRSGLRR